MTSSPSLAPLEDLEVPAYGKGISILEPSLPEACLVERSLTVLALYVVGVSTGKISAFLEGVYGTFSLPQSIFCLIEVTAIPLILAARWNKNPQILEVLLEAGTDATIPDDRGERVVAMLGKTLPLEEVVF